MSCFWCCAMAAGVGAVVGVAVVAGCLIWFVSSDDVSAELDAHEKGGL